MDGPDQFRGTSAPFRLLRWRAFFRGRLLVRRGSLAILVVPILVVGTWLVPAFAFDSHSNGSAKSPSANSVDLHEHPYRGKKPVEIIVGLYISNLAVVEETREQFQVEGYLTVEWDDPRLALPQGLRVPGHIRKLNPDELWSPPLETANMISHRRNSFELTVDDNGHLRYVERTDTTVSAYYSLRKFPFDTQTLEFQIEPLCPRLMSSPSRTVLPAQRATPQELMRA
jgi:neurotransmitter-gated ion-channel